MKPLRLRFWYRGDVCVLVEGRYSNDRLALVILGPGNCEESKVTVNLPDEELDDGEFFVKWAGDDGAMTRADTHALWKIGIFEDTGRRVDSGYVEAYAAVWKFKLCWWEKHSGKGGPRIVCEGCRADFDKDVARHVEHRESTEAVARMEELARIEAGGGVRRAHILVPKLGATPKTMKRKR